MNWSVSKDVQLLKLWIENNRDSAMAFQRGRLKREGRHTLYQRKKSIGFCFVFRRRLPDHD